MIDFIRSVAEFILKPLVVLSLAVVCAMVFSKAGKKRTAQIFAGLALIWFFLIFVSPLPPWLLHKLESRFSVLSIHSARGDSTHILVLGGGHSISPDLPPGHQLNAAALIRLVEAVRQYRHRPGSKIVCSGGSVSGRTPHATLLGLTALELGASPSDTILIITPTNTRDEAKTYARRFGKQHNLVLVTSAFHMERAMMYFHQLGLKPTPAITHQFVKIDPESANFNFVPSLMKIKMMEIVIHEYAGMLDAALFNENE